MKKKKEILTKNETLQTAIKKERNKRKTKNSDSETFCINIHNFWARGYCFLLFLLQYSTHVLDRGLFGAFGAYRLYLTLCNACLCEVTPVVYIKKDHDNMHIHVKDNHSCVESYLPEGCH